MGSAFARYTQARHPFCCKLDMTRKLGWEYDRVPLLLSLSFLKAIFLGPSWHDGTLLPYWS